MAGDPEERQKAAARLAQARKAAGFKSGRAASREHGWPESTYRSHESGTRTFSLEDARVYGAAYNVDADWLKDGTPSAGKQSPPVANALRVDRMVNIPMRRLPVFGRAVGGANGQQLLMTGEPVDYVVCPPTLETVRDAYAVYVVGESMEPRYFAGEVVYVHPGRPCKRGDFVVVQTTENGEHEPGAGYVKRFVAWTPTRLILEQLNPPGELEFEKDTVVSVHKIVFSGDF